jgi:hypothetical protein
LGPHLWVVGPQVPGSHKAGCALAEAAYEGNAASTVKHAAGIAEDHRFLANALQRCVAWVSRGDVNIKGGVVCDCESV